MQRAKPIMGSVFKTLRISGALLLLAATAANAQSSWQAKELKASDWPDEIVEETRDEAQDGLPDGLISEHTGGDIARAWYASPTERYAHGALGDAIEAGSLHVETEAGKRLSLVLPRSEVFEDRYPRLADLDGDGTVEIVTIRSSLTKGASVTVYGLDGEAIAEKATTGFYGRKNRWLNIAGIAPFLGIAGNEIAFVQTPHIGGDLFVLRYSRGRLIQFGAGEDFSNHVLGSHEMRLSAVADVDGDGRAELAVPSADRKALRIIGLTAKVSRVSSGSGSANSVVIGHQNDSQGGLKEFARVALPSPIDKAIGIETDRPRGFVVGLEDGSVYLVHQ